MYKIVYLLLTSIFRLLKEQNEDLTLAVLEQEDTEDTCSELFEQGNEEAASLISRLMHI